jgi:hypothetical protein
MREGERTRSENKETSRVLNKDETIRQYNYNNNKQQKEEEKIK